MSKKVDPTAKPKADTAKSKSKRAASDRRTGALLEVRPAQHPNVLEAVTGVHSGNRAEMLQKIRKGLPFSVIEILQKAFRASRNEIAALLSIPVSTRYRRKKVGRFNMVESDRVTRLASLKDAVLEMMRGDDEAAIQWLRTPNSILGSESPLAHATTDLGARDVEDLIGRISHGVFS